jgi:hypothetical protein
MPSIHYFMQLLTSKAAKSRNITAPILSVTATASYTVEQN